MIDLRNYFLDNVSEDDYYWRFKTLVEDVHVIYNVFDGPVEAPERDRCNFEVYDDKEAINKFRFLCGPNNASDCKEDKCWFYVVAYYRRCQGYMIREFPHVLDRPPLNLCRILFKTRYVKRHFPMASMTATQLLMRCGARLSTI